MLLKMYAKKGFMEINTIVLLLKEINIIQLISIGIMLWFFYSRLDKKIEKLELKIDNIDLRLSNKIDKLNDKVEDIDRRLCRIEGSLSSSGHCLFNQSKIEQKVE